MSHPLIVYYGPGKGKSTSAFGIALRTLGRGKKVLLVQFIKKPNTSGEQNIVQKIGMDYYCAGKGFVFSDISTEQKKPHKQAAQDGLDYAKQYLIQQSPGLIVLDEFLHVLDLFPDLGDQAYQLLSAAAETCPTIITGANLPDPIREIADYIYYLEEQKVPEDRGCIEGFHY